METVLRNLHVHKKAVVICLVLGFLIALMTRSSFVISTTDFSYYRIGRSAHPGLLPHDSPLYGKRVIGIGGFPFSTFTDCRMGYHGDLVSPACDSFSVFRGFSILLNTLFWACVSYAIFLLMPSSAKSDTNRRSAG